MCAHSVPSRAASGGRRPSWPRVRAGAFRAQVPSRGQHVRAQLMLRSRGTLSECHPGPSRRRAPRRRSRSAGEHTQQSGLARAFAGRVMRCAFELAKPRSSGRFLSCPARCDNAAIAPQVPYERARGRRRVDRRLAYAARRREPATRRDAGWCEPRTRPRRVGRIVRWAPDRSRGRRDRARAGGEGCRAARVQEGAQHLPSAA